jgi:hypothetical protein
VLRVSGQTGKRAGVRTGAPLARLPVYPRSPDSAKEAYRPLPMIT